MMNGMNIDPSKYDLAFQIGSKEHFKETGLTGETWHIPADDYFQRLERTQSMLRHIANVLNSGEFILSDRGFTTSMTLIRRDVKGGKNPNYRPGEKNGKRWSKRCAVCMESKTEISYAVVAPLLSCVSMPKNRLVNLIAWRMYAKTTLALQPHVDGSELGL